MGKNQHVTPHDKGWQVKGAGNQKATFVTSTKTEAQAFATCIAKNQRSEVVIHGRDGRIQNKNSFGNDPCPPKDRK